MEDKKLAKLTVSAVLLIAAVLYLCGVFTRGDVTYATPKLPHGLKDGTYSAQNENSFSTVRVDMTIRDRAVTDCEITSSGGPQDLLTDEIRSAWAKAIVDEQDPAPEAITGATLVFSAGSVQEAVRDILAQATGEKEIEPIPERTAPETQPSASDGEPKQDAVPVETPAAGTLLDGSYSAEKTNAFSTVRVDVNVAEGMIADCAISSSGGPQDLLTDEIRQNWAAAIVESQSASPDAVTGATLTFSAGSVREAMLDILAQAAGAEETVPAIAPEPAAPAEENPAAEEPAAPAETTDDASRMKRPRPAEAAPAAEAPAMEEPAAEEPATPAETTDDASRMMRPRPAEAAPAAVEPAADEPAVEEPAAEEPAAPAETTDDASRMMRPRPAEAVPAEEEPVVEGPAAEEPAAPVETTDDASRMMRPRPAEAAPAAEEPAVEGPAAEEPAAPAETTDDASRMMRPRP